MSAMKIEQPHSGVEATKRVGADAGSTPAKAVAPRGAEADAVQLSSDLQLADQAVRAAGTVEQRPEVVTRMRELHERGVLGVDVERLADRMIDALIHSDDHTP